MSQKAQPIHISGSTLFVRSYAKINLTLDVLGRRADGYHELATVMQTIDLYDTLCLTATDEASVRVVSTRPDLDGDDNLAVLEAQALRQRLKLPQGVGIELDKRIPVAAGLGVLPRRRGVAQGLRGGPARRHRGGTADHIAHRGVRRRA